MSKLSKENRQKFLFTFFDKIEGNENKNINGFILFKHYNSGNKKWQIDIFTPESFEKMRSTFAEYQKKLFKNAN
uniref:Uncharacterized protein n=1 Tax=viral metagenome TaxID=1070528 RepID=A0A6M3Y1N9_9ZZZZ